MTTGGRNRRRNARTDGQAGCPPVRGVFRAPRAGGDPSGRRRSPLRSDEELELSFPFPAFRTGVGQGHRGPFLPGHGKEEGEGPGGHQGGEKIEVAVIFHGCLPTCRKKPAFPGIVSQIPRAAKCERVRKGAGKRGAALAPAWKNMVIVEIQGSYPKPDNRGRI